jgi:hypothetical protein
VQVVRHLTSGIFTGQGKAERCALAQDRLYPNAALVTAHDLPANGQAHSTAGASVARLKTLEDSEDLFRVLGLDANSVIADHEKPLAGLSMG